MTPGDDLRAVPRHLAVIPDGNRRWARGRALPVAEGYAAGARAAVALVARCRDAGVKHLTAWASSVENLGRSAEEVHAIHDAVAWFCDQMAVLPGVALDVFGAPERLPGWAPGAEAFARLRGAATAAGRIHVHLGVCYEGRDELAAVAGAAVREGPEPVAREPHRFLHSAHIPPVDLLLRTGGHQHLSGFLPFHSTYAELYFIPALWPDFDESALHDALGWYAGRPRPYC